MAAISITNRDEFSRLAPHTDLVKTVIAGEAVEQGQTAAPDLSLTNNRYYLCDPSDANRRRFSGFFTGDAAAGEEVGLVMPGSIVTGHDFDPSGTAAHRAGNLVYTGTAGELADTQGTGAVQVGIIIPAASGDTSQQAILVWPEWTEGV